VSPGQLLDDETAATVRIQRRRWRRARVRGSGGARESKGGGSGGGVQGAVGGFK
jgi:hypothetical protein